MGVFTLEGTGHRVFTHLFMLGMNCHNQTVYMQTFGQWEEIEEAGECIKESKGVNPRPWELAMLFAVPFHT